MKSIPMIDGAETQALKRKVSRRSRAQARKVLRRGGE